MLGEGRKMALKIPSYWNQVLDSIRIGVFWAEDSFAKEKNRLCLWPSGLLIHFAVSTSSLSILLAAPFAIVFTFFYD